MSTPGIGETCDVEMTVLAAGRVAEGVLGDSPIVFGSVAFLADMPRPRTWTDERIERALRELCAGAQVFPSRGEFAAAGLRGLYTTLERRGELNAWAARIGLERRSPPAALASQATRVLWTDDRVERALREVCAGRERFPSTVSSSRPGLGGLYARLHRRGELDLWTARLGLARNRAAWTDDEIQCALDGLCEGLQRFPTRE